MVARVRLWWQQIKIHPITTTLILLFIAFVVLVIFGGYQLNWAWTGFNENSKSGKTLWDWMQLLIIPFVIAVAGYVINITISRSEQEAAQQIAKTEREIAHDNQREAALQEYIDKMSELLLHEKLRESAVSDEIVTIAQVRTLTVLSRLDAKRKKSLVEFLYSARLIFNNKQIIDLRSADLSFLDLNNSVLLNIDLSGNHLVRANLGFSNLNCASLSLANLCRANLFGAILRGADLRGSNLSRADLRGANLSKTNIDQGLLSDFNMTLDDIRSFADDERVGDLEADLSDADLSRANLLGAMVTDEQLTKAKSLKGATMPDGSIHP